MFGLQVNQVLDESALCLILLQNVGRRRHGHQMLINRLLAVISAIREGVLITLQDALIGSL